MNGIKAVIYEIQSCKNLHIVTFKCFDDYLTMMSLDLDSSIKVGVSVKLVVKPSSIAIAKDISGELSYSNQLWCKVLSVEDGELLSSIKLKYFDFELESIITRKSSHRVAINEGDDIIALIKASDLSIME